LVASWLSNPSCVRAIGTFMIPGVVDQHIDVAGPAGGEPADRPQVGQVQLAHLAPAAHRCRHGRGLTGLPDGEHDPRADAGELACGDLSGARAWSASSRPASTIAASRSRGHRGPECRLPPRDGGGDVGGGGRRVEQAGRHRHASSSTHGWSPRRTGTTSALVP